MRQVDPVEARTGDYIDTWDINQYDVMIRAGEGLERTLKQAGNTRELVFTRINKWSKSRRNDTWQIFLLP